MTSYAKTSRPALLPERPTIRPSTEDQDKETRRADRRQMLVKRAG